MKKIIFIVILFLFVLEVSAHPGRTDSNGGHTDHSTGTYHYHHGYPAHQHIDGICQYELKDNTANNEVYFNSSDTSSSNTSVNNSISASSASKTKSTHTLGRKETIILSVIGGYFALLILVHVYEAIKSKIVTKRKEELKRQEEYNKYYALYANKDPISLVEVPEGVYLKNGIPVTKGAGKYGAYTVYITSKGNCFHQNPFCVRNAYPKHIIEVYKTHQGCKRCFKQSFPKYKWYFEYKEIVDIKKKYNIP